MLYQMKQKIWTLGDRYTIKDANGHDCFRVEGRVWTLGDKLSFQDMSGQELAFIEQKLLRLRPTYVIYRRDELFAEVVKDWTFLKSRFTVDVPGPNDYVVKGDFFDHEFEFLRSDRPVARVSREYFTWAGTYGIWIVDGEDDVTILATAVVIDLVCHNIEGTVGG